MTTRLRLAGVLSLTCIAAAFATPTGAGAQPAPFAFGACSKKQQIIHVPGLQCATLDVPFDRADPALGEIALAVQRVPASAPHTGVLVLLAGGPGQPALPPFEQLIAPLAHNPALRGFEIVAFDQRGTGQSEGLLCAPTSESPAVLLRGGPFSFLTACGTALGPTRAFYSSQESVEDLDALREALGGTPLSLLAVSYGTRVAGMYAREHPQGVARMVLDSLVPSTGPQPLGLERLHALRRVLDEGLCGDGACRAFSGDVYADLVRLVARLHRHPLQTKIYSYRGRLRRVRITETSLLRMLTDLDLERGTRELAPAAIAAAAHGNPVPLARLAGAVLRESIGGVFGLPRSGSPLTPVPGWLDRAARPAEEPSIFDIIDSTALYLATSCVEDEMPWSPASPPAGRAAILHRWLASIPAAATAPFSRTTALQFSDQTLCEHWPATTPAPPSPTGLSATPTLILSGDDDLRTPYEQVLGVLPQYSDAQLLRVPDDGHSTISTDPTGCANEAMVEFIASGRAPASCAPSGEPPALPLPPSSLARVTPAASRSRLAGRVASAAAITLEDLLGQTSFAGGGLRGGYWELGLGEGASSSIGYRLHDMRDVPGVELSGRIHLREGATPGEVELSGQLTVRGRLPGKLALHGRVLSGRVGGARVHAVLAAL